MKNIEWEKWIKNTGVKNITCYYFDDMMTFKISNLIIFYWMKKYIFWIRLEDLCKTLIGFITVYYGTKYLDYLVLKNMVSFLEGLDIL